MNGSVLLQIIKASPAAHKEKETTNQCTPKFMLSEILEHEKKTVQTKNEWVLLRNIWSFKAIYISLTVIVFSFFFFLYLDYPE